jgi:glycosyltransferase involved in cell wall biosynthesis
MATFNGGQFIDEQMASIMAQLGLDDEVVIADDGSTDDTVQRIRRYGDARIRVLESEHRGATKSFERALSQTRGRYVFLADHDDVWLEGKLEQTCEALAAHELVVTDCKVVDTERKVLHESYFNLLNSEPGLLLREKGLRRALVRTLRSRTAI